MKIGTRGFSFVGLLLLPVLAGASGYEFEGIGARQVSRAGAATAAADDWSAVYWNPANLVTAVRGGRRRIGVEVFGGQAFSRDSDSLSVFSSKGISFGKDRMSSGFLLGAVGAALPLGERAALGLGVYTPLLQGIDFQDTSTGGVRTRYKGSAGILSSNLSLAFRLVPGLTFGGGVGLLYGRLQSESQLVDYPAPGMTTTGAMAGDGYGLEGIVGLRWVPNPRVALGAVYRTGADVKINGNAEGSITGLLQESSWFRFSLNQPPTSDLGVAWRPVDAWTFSCDLHQTYWHRFSNAISYGKQGTLLVDTPNTMNWRDTWKLRLGTSWRVSEKTELLGGYSYDRYGVDAGSLDFSTTVDVPMHRVSTGWSRDWGRGFESVIGVIFGHGERSEGAQALHSFRAAVHVGRTVYVLVSEGRWDGVLQAILDHRRRGGGGAPSRPFLRQGRA